MKTFSKFFLLWWVLGSAFFGVACRATEREETEVCGKVKRVFDGDTFLLQNGEKVRLIGIDTPEIHPGDKLDQDAKRSGLAKKELQARGRKAGGVTHKLVQGKTVCLQYGDVRQDVYGRTLAYVFFKIQPDQLDKIVGMSPGKTKKGEEETFMLNRVLVQFGYAEVFRRFPFAYRQEFQALEKKAREQHLGLWKE